jgi:transposase
LLAYSPALARRLRRLATEKRKPKDVSNCVRRRKIELHTGLMKDESAVRAAMTYDWSNGQVEGNVNWLKMIKRMMFGRAGFALLRSRVLYSIHNRYF